MYILSFLGSPNKNGHTNQILSRFEKYIDPDDHYERINLIDYNIKHCIGCNKCNIGDFSCVFDDDMTTIYKKIEQADLIILATPIYFNSVTSILKAMIDRCQRFYNMKVNNDVVFKRKKGVLIATAGSAAKDSFIGFEKIADYFFKAINGEIIYKQFTNNTDNGLNLSAIDDSIKEIYGLLK